MSLDDGTFVACGHDPANVTHFSFPLPTMYFETHASLTIPLKSMGSEGLDLGRTVSFILFSLFLSSRREQGKDAIFFNIISSQRKPLAEEGEES